MGALWGFLESYGGTGAILASGHEVMVNKCLIFRLAVVFLCRTVPADL